MKKTRTYKLKPSKASYKFTELTDMAQIRAVSEYIRKAGMHEPINFLEGKADLQNDETTKYNRYGKRE